MRFRSTFVVLLATLTLTAPYYAQTTSATLSGAITNPAGRVVPAVDVTATTTPYRDPQQLVAGPDELTIKPKACSRYVLLARPG